MRRISWALLLCVEMLCIVPGDAGKVNGLLAAATHKAMLKHVETMRSLDLQ